MSAAEGFRELTDRLKRERETEHPRRYDQVAGKPLRPPLPAPLRLPAGDPRRRQVTDPDLPPPLFTGILGIKPTGYRHPIRDWRWNPYLCEWIGRCPVCRYRFRADRQISRWLDRELLAHERQETP